MTLFLNGGGSGERINKSYRLFKEKADTTKPLLFIPFARGKEEYPDSLKWITKEVAECNFPQIDMPTSVEELASKDFNKYGAIFIGGGNTYKLLANLKSCSAYNKIQNFLEKDGTIFGGSAGTIIFGKNLDSCAYVDVNDVNLQDASGFNQVFGAYMGAHYKNGEPERDKKAFETFTKLSFEAPVIALPEEDTLMIDKDKVYIIGTKIFHIFKEGMEYKIQQKIYSANDFKKLLESPENFAHLSMKVRDSRGG